LIDGCCFDLQARGGVKRRTLLHLAAGLLAYNPRLLVAMANAGSKTLLSVPLELTGDWGRSPRPAAVAVMSRMRAVSLAGVELLSDRQPDLLRIQANRSGPPAVWLHPDGSRMAWVIVDVGERDWSKLAYQFGHELGHVLANSWGPQARPAPPCQWLEEALVEAFSIRGLALLAESWERNPPFTGDAGFAEAIRRYRAKVIAGYSKPGDPASWVPARHRISFRSGVPGASSPRWW